MRLGIWIALLLISFSTQAIAEEKAMHKYTNALIDEASPYLQQHAHNPVHWYPWGEVAFAKAKKEDKPIFLSIGYATCHWCHVMEHECFEDEEVAKAMNDTFIAIKVDREERPDIDQVYMQVAQMMNGHGGWPLNIIMTADKKPFFAGTYIPKYSRNGRVGMLDLSTRLKKLWTYDRDKLEESADKITQLLASNESNSWAEAKLDVDALAKQATADLKQSFDHEYAGFGDAPKFPSPHKLLFLLREAKSHDDKQALSMVEQTLDAMRAGGVFDQVGFGFHRYSTDAQWLLPHFEKMLYDQAMLMMAYTEAYQLTGHKRHAAVVREIATYVLRDMRDETGGFYSAEDADSEGVEGKFYVWSMSELEDVLGKDDAKRFAQAFQCSKQGNFRDEATGKITGENIPHLSAWMEQGLSPALDNMRNTLFQAREKRVHPFKDDKILTDWNGLMIAAFAKAARALHEPKYLQAAKDSADFMLTTMQQEDGSLWHRYRHGDVGITGHLDDYAFFVWGLIDLYEASLDATYLKQALALNQHMLQSFASKSGGLYLTAHDAEALLVRPMEAWDGALPSGNAVAAMNMVRLARISSDSDLEVATDKLFQTFSGAMKRAPIGLTSMISAHVFAAKESIEIVLAGDKESAQAKAMLDAINRLYLPYAVVIWRDEASMKLIPFIQYQKPQGEGMTAYVCKNFQCNQPVTDVQSMLKLIQE